MKLREAAKYLESRNPPKTFRSLVASIKRVFHFRHERANRVARFIVITRAYAKNEDINRIAARFGCGRGTVLRYARLAGLPKRPRHFGASVRRAVIRDYKAKMSVADIARLHEVSQAYVSKTAREAGISRYQRRPEKRQRK